MDILENRTILPRLSAIWFVSVQWSGAEEEKRTHLLLWIYVKEMIKNRTRKNNAEQNMMENYRRLQV